MKMVPCRSLPLWVVLCILASWGAGAAAPGQGPGPAVSSPPSRAGSPSTALPQDWYRQVTESIRAEEYSLTCQSSSGPSDRSPTWQAPNRAQGFRSFFDESGIRIVPRTGDKPAWEWGLSPKSLGRPGGAEAVPPATPSPRENRVEYRRGGLAETYLNEERGLALSLTVASCPEGGGPLHLEFALSGDLLPRFSEDGSAVDFFPSGGMSVLRLAYFGASDASGSPLPARLEGFCGEGFQGLRVVVDDATAAYPVRVEGLATTAAWTVESHQAGANLGYSVATAGDVNGDGFSDVLVAIPFYDNGQADEGVVWLFLGSASGLNSSPDWYAESNDAGADFGSCVSTAGDANGDGYSDILIGADLYGANNGAAFCFYGPKDGSSPTGNPGNSNWSFSTINEYFGNSVSTAGDVNADGYSDVLVGAPHYGSLRGCAYLFLGGPAGLEPTFVWQSVAPSPDKWLGQPVAAAGDVNGDGFSDVLLGSNGYSNSQFYEGRTCLYLGTGSAPWLPPTPSWTFESDQADAHSGLGSGGVGDLNGDGYSDILVSAYLYHTSLSDAGKIFVFYGAPGGPAATPDWTAESGQSGAHLGSMWRGTFAGDVNGDGYADLAASAEYYDSATVDGGAVFLWYGGPSGLGPSGTPANADWAAYGGQTGSVFGFSLATAGDVNGDGYTDMLVGSSLYHGAEADEGRAYLFLGSPDGLSTAFTWSSEGNQANAYWGSGLAAAGDVDGDGYVDLLVSSSAYDTAAGADAGKVLLYYGSSSGPDATPDWFLEGTQADGRLGTSASGANDVNGDGYADVLIGESGYTNGQVHEGRALLFFGSPSGLGGIPNWTFESNQTYLTLGNPVADAGDADGDGFADIIVGAPGQFECNCPGRAYFFRGSSTGPAASPDWTAAGNNSQAWFGNAVGTAGDVNGDGYSDVFIGEHGYNVNRGRVMVWLGSSTGLGAAGTPGNADWTGSGDGDSEWFGYCASSAGDVNRDGYSDLLVGAPEHNGGQSREGRACVFLGSSAGLEASPAWAAESDQAVALLGYSVCGAGDLNGDGFSDIAAGAFAYDGAAGADCGKIWAFFGSSSGPGTSGAWSREGVQAGEYLGVKVAAGDGNGDGFSDLLACAQAYDGGENDEGRAILVFGGGGAGQSLHPRQRRYNGTSPIAPLGKTDNRNGFRVAALGRTPFGRGDVKLEVEVKPLGSGFNGTGLVRTDWADTGTGGAALEQVISDPLPGGNHWRARLLYHPVTTPFQTRGRWFTQANNGWHETDVLVIPEADVRITSFTDSPDPGCSGRTLTHTVSVNNVGPDIAAGVTLTETLTLTLVDVTFDAGASDPRWVWDGGAKKLTANLGAMSIGGNDTLVAVFTLSDGGTVQADAAVSTVTGDPDLGNNTALAVTTVPPCADLSITSFTDSPDPALTCQEVTYAVSVRNDGPQDASAVTVTEVLSLTGTTVAFQAASSDPLWVWDEGSKTLTASIPDFFGAGATDTLLAVFTVGGTGTIANQASIAGAEHDPVAANNSASVSTQVTPLAIGNTVWRDDDADGIQDLGEPGLAGVVVDLYDGDYGWLARRLTNPSGGYTFSGLSCGASYLVKFFLPSADYVFSPADQGGDDLADSDADTATGQTPIFALTDGRDYARWDCGMVPGALCIPPDEPVWMYLVTLSDPDDFPILHFMDPNQANQVTGYNIYRTYDSGKPHAEWTLVASNVRDMDEATPNKQWADTSGDDPPTGYAVWYYEVAATNAHCPPESAEGPW